jgi:transmembrane sensor
MKQGFAADESHRDLHHTAASWHGLFEDRVPTSTEREQFEAWLDADPRHRAAYDSIDCSWDFVAAAAVDERVMAMRREALAAPGKRSVSWGRPAAIAASIVVCVLVFGSVWRFGSGGANQIDGEFVTQVGQRSSITLNDGSTVVLNTASRIHVDFNARERRVQLLAGQALFNVAKNYPLPFVVEAGDRRVTAHGTAFDIRLEDHNQLQVTLIEGRVSVDPLRPNGSTPAMSDHEDLLPGDQLVIAPRGAPEKHKADLTKATSWREGQIILDDDTLENAIAEVNRYSARKIILADPKLASLRLSGVFIAGHSDTFVETVTENFPIKATASRDGRVLLSAAN